MDSKEYINKLSDSDKNSFSDAILKILPYFLKYKDTKNLEIEFRLGYLEKDNSFTATINEQFFNNLIKTFNESDVFLRTEEKYTDIYNNEARKTLKENGHFYIIKKTKLCNIDFHFEGTPFDLRVSFSKETPVKKFVENDNMFIRNKHRYSYSYEYFNYDFTAVTYTENKLTDTTYEFELEINKTINQIMKKEDIHYIIHNSLVKIKDLAMLCEEECSDNLLLKFNKVREYS